MHFFWLKSARPAPAVRSVPGGRCRDTPVHRGVAAPGPRRPARGRCPGGCSRRDRPGRRLRVGRAPAGTSRRAATGRAAPRRRPDRRRRAVQEWSGPHLERSAACRCLQFGPATGRHARGRRASWPARLQESRHAADPSARAQIDLYKPGDSPRQPIKESPAPFPDPTRSHPRPGVPGTSRRKRLCAIGYPRHGFFRVPASSGHGASDALQRAAVRPECR